MVTPFVILLRVKDTANDWIARNLNRFLSSQLGISVILSMFYLLLFGEFTYYGRSIAFITTSYPISKTHQEISVLSEERYIYNIMTIFTAMLFILNGWKIWKVFN